MELVDQAAGWEVPQPPVLGEVAYGDNTELRERLHGAGREYLLAVAATTTVCASETNFVVGERAGISGRPRSRARPDRKPETIEVLVKRLERVLRII